MKVAQLLATIPDALPPEYAGELMKLQSEAPPMGWAFVQAAHDGRARRRLAEEIRKLRARAGRGRLARPGASRRARSDGSAARLQAAISRHAVRGRGRSQPARHAARAAPAHGSRDRHERDRQGDRRARCAKSSTIMREAKHVALYRRMLADSRASACRRCGRSSRRGRLLTLDWLEGTQAARLIRTRRSPTRNRLAHGDVHGLVDAVQPLRRDPWRSASRQLHRVRGTGRQARRRHQSPRLWLHPHLPAGFVGGVVDLYHGLQHGDEDARRPRLRDLGLQAICPAS